MVLSHFENLAHPSHTFQQEAERFFLSVASEHRIKFFGSVEGLLIASGSEVSLAEEDVELREGFEVADVLDPDHLSGLVEVLHALLDVFADEVDLSQQEVVLPQGLVVSSEYLLLHLEGVLSVLQS
jgi:hypothetical protein